MKIDNIELSKEEMNEAVTSFLKTRGLTIAVTEVESIGYPVRAWRLGVTAKITALPIIDPISNEMTAVVERADNEAD